MSTTIDAGGRVVIPKHLRDATGLLPGARVDIVVRDGMVVLVPVHAKIALVERDGTLAAEAEGEMPTLTTEAVRDAIEAARR